MCGIHPMSSIYKWIHIFMISFLWERSVKPVNRHMTKPIMQSSSEVFFHLFLCAGMGQWLTNQACRVFPGVLMTGKMCLLLYSFKSITRGLHDSLLCTLHQTFLHLNSHLKIMIWRYLHYLYLGPLTKIWALDLCSETLKFAWLYIPSVFTINVCSFR